MLHDNWIQDMCTALYTRVADVGVMGVHFTHSSSRVYHWTRIIYGLHNNV